MRLFASRFLLCDALPTRVQRSAVSRLLRSQLRGNRTVIHVFVAICDAIEDRVTIIAHDADEAYLIFLAWCDHHRGGIPSGDTEVLRLDRFDLAGDPALLEALNTGQTGIARWLGHHAGWLVTLPDVDTPGVVAPPFCPLSCFLFETQDFGAIYVVAETQERATALLHLRSLDRNGWDADYDGVREISPWTLTGYMGTLREDMFVGKTGVGLECEDGYWRIFPADYEPPLSDLAARSNNKKTKP